MSSIIYPSSWATTPVMTLHNGTTHFAKALITQTQKAELDLIMLPNHVIYDPNGPSVAAPTVPARFVAEIIIKLATQALIVAEWAAWELHVGKIDTLTATKISSGTVTCTARLESITNVYPFQDSIDKQITVEAAFVPLTAWA